MICFLFSTINLYYSILALVVDPLYSYILYILHTNCKLHYNFTHHYYYSPLLVYITFSYLDVSVH